MARKATTTLAHQNLAHQNTEGENATGKPDVPPEAPTEGQAAAQGGEETILPADKGALGNVDPADGATGAGGPGEARIVVTCLAEGGRRRLGRRWPSGPTEVPAGELTDDDIAILRGDPRFSVAVPAA